MLQRITLLLSAAAVFLISPLAAHAGGLGDLSVSDGMGEEVSIKNPWLGKKSKVFKDRLGNSFLQEKGMLGSQETGVSVLGNKFEKKKGLFGSSQIEGSTIMGDKIVSKKGLFRRRKTQVDLSGTSALIRGFLGRSAPPAIVAPPPMQHQIDSDPTVQP